jgi:hypothetical protein
MRNQSNEGISVVRREFMQRLSAVLQCSFGYYLPDTLQEGSAYYVARLPAAGLGLWDFLFLPFSCLVNFTAFLLIELLIEGIGVAAKH